MDWSEFEKHLKIEIQNLGGRYVWSDVQLQGGYHIQKNVKNHKYRLLETNDKTIHKGTLAECKEILATKDAFFNNDHLILLIHGLGRHSGTMKKPLNALRQTGFAAHSLNYASLFEDVEHHADYFEHLLDNLIGIKKVSFVTHSLGGLIVRELLKRKTKWNDVTAGKLVMMGTPNKGAQIAEFLNRLKAYQVIMGPSGQNVRPIDKLNALPPPPIQTLVIAGGRGNETGFNPLLNGDNDGIVCVEETRIDGKEHFQLVHVIHTTIMDHKDSIKAMLEFLKP
jgi:pimeloyl-ACP methyl ester carboxylesterase